MSSLHSTLTALIDALVRDILRVVRESSVHELVRVDGRATPSVSPRGRKGKEKEKASPSASRPRARRTAQVAKRGAAQPKPRDVRAGSCGAEEATRSS